MAETDAILRRHCEELGRDEKEIERTAGMGVVVIRDSREEARRVFASLWEHNGKARPWENQPVGTVEDVIAHVEAYLEMGYRHLIFSCPSPYDEETMTRIANEVRPALERKLVDGGRVGDNAEAQSSRPFRLQPWPSALHALRTTQPAPVSVSPAVPHCPAERESPLPERFWPACPAL